MAQIANNALADFVISRMVENDFTKDVPLLNVYNTQLVFAYGTLRSGFSRHAVLSENNAEFMCHAFTCDTNLDFKYSVSGQFPIAFHTANAARAGRIHGEIWSVPSSCLTVLDRLEQNGKLFDRKRISCLYANGAPDSKGQMPIIRDVWFYFGDRLKGIADFHEVKEKESSLYGKYYTYNHMIEIVKFGGYIKT